MSSLDARYAIKAYARTASEIANPRQLEARLLLKAAAKLQAIYDRWDAPSNDLYDALLYNRRLWVMFLVAVTGDDNKLASDVRQNIANLGIFVMGQTLSLMTKPDPEHLLSIIKINRALAAGLSAQR